MGIKHVLILNEADGPISLTRIEVDYLIAVTNGEPHGGKTGTQRNLVMKIRREPEAGGKCDRRKYSAALRTSTAWWSCDGYQQPSL